MSPFALLHGGLDDLPAWDAWHFAPSTVIGAAALAGAYLWAIGPGRERLGGEPVPRWKVGAFLAGCLALVLTLNGPIHELSDHYLLSAHMVQHLLLTMVVPLLWLLGTPGWLVDAVLDRVPGLERIGRVATGAVVAYLVYNAWLVAWHMPTIYDLALFHHPLHVAQHLGFLATGVLMWWPVASPTERLPALSYGPAMLYLFLLTIPMKAIGAFVTLADHVLYDFYASAPRVLGLSAATDQTIGGLVMWIPGGLIYWTAIAIIFLRHYHREVGIPGHRPSPAVEAP